MNDELERRLRDAMTRVVPPLPDNPHRYADVRRRARRRRAAQAGAGIAALAVVVAGIGIVPEVLTGSSRTGRPPVATSTPSSPQTRAPAGPTVDCPARPGSADGEPEDDAQRTGPLVPDGAVAARMCNIGLAGDRGGPDEHIVMLRARTSQLVRMLNDLTWQRSDGCPTDLGPTFDLVLRYPDGRQVIVSADNGGCGHVRTGEEFRVGAERVWTFTRDLMEGQRLDTTTPPSPQAPECPQSSDNLRSSSVAVSPGPDPVPFAATVVTLCRFEHSSTGRPPDALLGSAELTERSDVEEMRTAVNSGTGAVRTCQMPSGSYVIDVLVFRDPAGGITSMAVWRARCSRMYGDGVDDQATPRALFPALDARLGPAPSR